MRIGLSEHDIEYTEKIICGGYGDWFTAHLMRLINKADHENTRLLSTIYPQEVAAVVYWKNTGRTLDNLIGKEDSDESHSEDG